MTKILFVEDEKLMAEMYKDKLEQSGFETILASTSKEGLDKARKENPDLIVLDMLLPIDSGIVFLTKIKKEVKLRSIPVLAFSNYDEIDTKKQALALGAKAYLLKTSFTPQGLIKEIKKYL